MAPTNSATLAAIAASEGAFRGVAVVGAGVADAELAALHRGGMRGLRINPLYKNAAGLADCQRLAERIAPLGWHLQIFLDVSGLSQQDQAMLSRLPVPIVIDHMGYMPVSKGLDDPGFQWLLGQLAEGHAWVKLSGAYYLASTPGPPYGDVAPFAHALIEANPQRCLWASNWPSPYGDRPDAQRRRPHGFAGRLGTLCRSSSGDPSGQPGRALRLQRIAPRLTCAG